MTYRVLTPDDKETLKEFCKQHDAAYPDAQIVFGAFEPSGELIAYGAVKKVFELELFSQNKFATMMLAEKCMAVVAIQAPKVQLSVDENRPDYIDVLEHYGFEVTHRNMAILKKGV